MGGGKSGKFKKNGDFLSQLQMLRDFVGTSFAEQDLSACLRQCGCNVHSAAEKLMTGKFQPKKAVSSKSSVATTTATASSTKRPRVTPTNSNKKKKPASTAVRPVIPKNVPTASVASLSESTTTLSASTPSNYLLLCQRWVVGLSTTKMGRVGYKEVLELSHSQSGPPVVRFRGKAVEGTLPANICALLTPLLRHTPSLLSLQAEALMEDVGINIGSDVPLALKIFIKDPVAFFGLFNDTTAASTEKSAKSQYFGKAKKGKRLPMAQAAFGLLQWAHYGDDLPFTPPPPQDDSSDEDDDDRELKEDDFVEAERSELTTTVVENAATALPEADDPVGFVNGVVLRPYQRQALHWMMERESNHENRDELEKELQLLSELSSNTAAAVQRASMDEPVEGIVCEVGPVRVSSKVAMESRTIHGVQNPVNHPLWQRRFLASPNKSAAISFYVNELLGTASCSPPNPPRSCTGGLLSDAMGLGKTVMLLALILKDKETKVASTDGKQSAATLVVAPLSLVAQWEEELATKTSLSHRVYYADTAKGSFAGLDVLVTTYGTIQAEMSSKKTNLLSYDWRRVILDEAHGIKNPSTLVSRACCMLKAERRWCVTGTPIQNSLQDVYALLKFLKHEPWCEGGFWKAAITSNTAAAAGGGGGSSNTAAAATAAGNDSNDALAQASTALNRVRRLLAPIILRRTKETLNKDGQPILTLPPVETKTVQVEFSSAEREFYTCLLQKSQSLFQGFLKDGTATKSYFQIFSLLNRLRQACDHVALTVKSQMDETEWKGLELDKKKAATPKKSNDKDALGDDFLGELLQKFQADKENHETSYASNVAHALAKSVKGRATTTEDECPICLDCPKIDEAVITPCAHIFCRTCLVDILKNGSSQVQVPNGTCPSCQEPIEAKQIVALSSENGRMTTSYLVASPKKQAASPGDSAARQTLENALRGAGSAKLTAVVKELHNVWQQDPGSKVLIFSQYLGFLDLLETSLRSEQIPFGRLDGKLSLKERIKALEGFRGTSSSTRDGVGSVLLMSMKAGGTGLNLCDASTVFIVDRWWNAAVEEQCISRCVRIGQTADVIRVRKFVVQDSVEERIVELQQRKTDMACEILSDTNADGALSNSKPTLDDLKLLFRL